ncbi:MAG: LPP20 family lipoprotein [Campylobacterota bacterium]|nr:LPP20 family lipoprotein [Campylobacterota bacterium]
MKYFTKGMLISLSTALVLGLTGCSSKDTKLAEEEADFRCRIDNALAPEWACGNAMTEGAITAVGSAPLSKAGQGFSRREALANGRSNLAQQIETLVKDKVETFARSTGVSADEVVDKVSTQVSKQVAKVTLKGSKQIKFWQQPTTKELYVLVGVPEGSVNEAAKESVKSSFKNDNALWQQFQSKQALESLEKEFPTD